MGIKSCHNPTISMYADEHEQLPGMGGVCRRLLFGGTDCSAEMTFYAEDRVRYKIWRYVRSVTWTAEFDTDRGGSCFKR